MRESIHRVNAYDKDAYTYYPVLIVGAGMSGIAMGCQLKEQLGFDQFRIFERQGGIGGTWWINRYPGVACDVPAVLYSFSFCPNPKWTQFYPQGSEIVKYLQEVCDKYGITDKVQCNTDVEECRWLPNEQVWEIRLRHLVLGVGDLSSKDRLKLKEEKGENAVYAGSETVKAKVLLSAVGGLVEPKGWPEEIPGYNLFKGPIFHSARWDYDVDFKDKKVVVVGTGCSAAQFVPQLTKAPFHAKSVTQLMRSPPWVTPRLVPPFGTKQWTKWSPVLFSRIPGLLKLMRFFVFIGAEEDFVLFGGTKKNEKARKNMEEKLLQHMKTNTPAKYHEILTPNYSVGCKRRIYDATWLPGLQDDNIDLTTRPLRSIQEDSVTIGPGRTYPSLDKSGSQVPTNEEIVPADIVVLANGFDTTKWLHPLKVIGQHGKDIVQEMEDRGGPQAYLGAAMDGFPNFFIIFGPNLYTGHTSVLHATENIINYLMPFIKLILDGDAKTIDVKHEAEVEYTKDIQQKLKESVWMQGGCQSWYFTEDGWNGTGYPYSQYYLIWKCMFRKWGDWNIDYTRIGIIKLVLRRAARLLVLTILFGGIYRAKQGKTKIRDLYNYLLEKMARITKER